MYAILLYSPCPFAPGNHINAEEDLSCMAYMLDSLLKWTHFQKPVFFLQSVSGKAGECVAGVG